MKVDKVILPRVVGRCKIMFLSSAAENSLLKLCSNVIFSSSENANALSNTRSNVPRVVQLWYKCELVASHVCFNLACKW